MGVMYITSSHICYWNVFTTLKLPVTEIKEIKSVCKKINSILQINSYL